MLKGAPDRDDLKVVRLIRVLVPLLLVVTACSTTETQTVSDAGGVADSDVPVLEPASTTTEPLPEVVPPSTAAEADPAEPVEPAPDDPDRVAHLLEPWLPEKSELPAGTVITMEFSSWGDSSFDECPETAAFDLLEEWLQFEISYETSTSYGGHIVGIADPQTSPHVPIAALADSADCIRGALEEGDGEFIDLESSVGPAVDGIVSSSIIEFAEERVQSRLVFATTGDRIVHVLTARSGEPIPEAWIEKQLRSIVERTADAVARVDECAAKYTDRFQRITEQRCDGFELWVPELELRSFDENSLVDLLDEDGSTDFSYYGWYPTSELMLLPDDIGDGAGGMLGEPDVPPGLTICVSELGKTARVAAQFDQWLQVESRLNDPRSGAEVLHTVGVAPSSEVAAETVRAYASFDSCEELTRALGARDFRSEDIPDLPKRVVAGMVWTIERGDETTIVADFAFDNGVVTSISLTSPDADLDGVRDLLSIVLSRMDLYDARVAAEG